MSELIDKAVVVLQERMTGTYESTAKFVIPGEGTLMIDSDGVRAGDDEADVVLTADADTFQSILSGDTDPTNAFMMGKLSIEGDMGAAMQLASVIG